METTNINKTDQLLILEKYVLGKLLTEVKLISQAKAKDADGVDSNLEELILFIGTWAAADILTVFQDIEVDAILTTVNKNKVYNEHFYQGILMGMLVLAESFDGGWADISARHVSAADIFLSSIFLPENIRDRISTKRLGDPYLILAYMLRVVSTDFLAKLQVNRGKLRD